MGAGQFDRRIAITRATVEENDAGEEVETGWTPFINAWAKYLPVSDGERWRAGAVEQKTDARFVIRWSAKRASITGEHRLTFDGADWQITGIKEIGRRQRLEITAWRLGKTQEA